MANYHFDVIPVLEDNVTVSVDDFNKHPNDYFNTGDITWMLISSALVFLMVPGVGLFYSGVSKRHSAVSMVWLPVFTAALISLEWYLWGYAVAFAPSSNKFWGSTHGITLAGVLAKPSGNPSGRRIPELLYEFYQGMFASFTAALVSGAVIRKGRVLPFLVFIVLWSTFVYNPIARWTWNPDGWAYRFGAMDFAGGTAVHINAGSSAAVYSFFFKIRAWLGRRRAGVSRGLPNPEDSPAPPADQANQVEAPPPPRPPPADQANQVEAPPPPRPHNIVNVVIGTIFLWIGWFGFNGGSALGANIRAVSACVSTFVAACAGGVTWSILEYVLLWLRDTGQDKTNVAHETNASHGGRFSVLGFCNGVIAGLVAITPAAGYVPCRSAPVFGICATLACSVANITPIREILGDELDIFVIHAIGGLVGMILTGCFARKSVPFLDGYTVVKGGPADHHGVQVGIQICDALAGMGYAAAGTFAILVLMELLMYPWRNYTDSEVIDEHDIQSLELLEMQDLA